ncbi:MAG: hypothetical protein ACPGQS_04575 [Bradymonadia bacterium]
MKQKTVLAHLGRWTVALIVFLSTAVAAQEQGWRLGAVTFRNVAGVTSFEKSADLTYNPTVSSLLSIAPSHLFKNQVALRLGVGLSYEWTNPDFQTTRHEVWLSDPSVMVTYPLLTLGKGVRLTGGTGLIAPLSPISKAASLITRLDQSLTLSSTVSGWTFSYAARGSKLFHEFTTGQLEDARIGACTGDSCLTLVHTGLRNASWSTSHFLSTSYAVTSSLSLMLSGGVIAAGLYPLTSVPSLPDDVGTDMRYLASSRVSASYALNTGCSMSGGVESFHTQLRPDGIRQTVLFNRYAQVFIDFMLTETCFGSDSKG